MKPKILRFISRAGPAFVMLFAMLFFGLSVPEYVEAATYGQIGTHTGAYLYSSYSPAHENGEVANLGTGSQTYKLSVIDATSSSWYYKRLDDIDNYSIYIVDRGGEAGGYLSNQFTWLKVSTAGNYLPRIAYARLFKIPTGSKSAGLVASFGDTSNKASVNVYEFDANFKTITPGSFMNAGGNYPISDDRTQYLLLYFKVQDGAYGNATSMTHNMSTSEIWNGSTVRTYLILRPGIVTLNNQGATKSGTTVVYNRHMSSVALEKDGSKQMVDHNEVVNSAYKISLPEKTNYTFGGYYTGPNGTGTQMIDATGKATSNFKTDSMSTGGTLYAKWTLNSYTQSVYVQYQNADGSYASPSLAAQSNILYGSTFAWNWTGNTTAYVTPSSISYTVTGIKSTTVQIARRTYTQNVYVRYQNADGTYGNFTLASSTAVRYGATFNWSWSGNTTMYSTPSSISYTVTASDTKYVTVNRKTYTQNVYVRYQNANGTYGNYALVQSTAVRYGATFVWGWSGNTAMYVTPSSLSYTVTGVGNKYVDVGRTSFIFDLNGYLDNQWSGSISGYGTADVYVNGSLVANDVTDFYNQILYGSTVQVTDVKATSGHTYLGVYSGTSYVSSMTAASSAQLRFMTDRKVTLNGNGATIASNPASVTAKYGQAMPTSTIPKRTYTVSYDANSGTASKTSETVSYTFKGYYDYRNSDNATLSGTQYYTATMTSSRTWDKIADTTLYAAWTSNTVTLPTATKDGYTLHGWTDGTTVYDPESQYTPTSDVTLKAVWSADILVYDIDIYAYNGGDEGVIGKYITHGVVGEERNIDNVTPTEYEGYTYVCATTCVPTLNTEDNIIYRFYNPNLTIGGYVLSSKETPVLEKNETALLIFNTKGYAETVEIIFPDEFLGKTWNNKVTGNRIDLTEDTSVLLGLTTPKLTDSNHFAFVVPNVEFEGKRFTIELIARRGQPCDLFMTLASEYVSEIETKATFEVTANTSVRNFLSRYRTALMNYDLPVKVED